MDEIAIGYGSRPPAAGERPTCTAIVCAYNEESTVGGVVASLLESPLIDQVVAVDDGSSDGTSGVLRELASCRRLRTIVFPQNRGKGWAMAEATLQARGEALLFMDADLRELRSCHVEHLLSPLLRGEADMVVGCPIRGRRISLVEWLDPFRPLAGERALWRQELLPLVEQIRSSGYGVETLLNLHYRWKKLRVQSLYLSGLIHPIKLEKAGPIEALRMYACEGQQIARATLEHYPLVLAACGLEVEGWVRLRPRTRRSLSGHRHVPHVSG